MTRVKKAIDNQWDEIEKERNRLIESYENLGGTEEITRFVSMKNLNQRLSNLDITDGFIILN